MTLYGEIRHFWQKIRKPSYTLIGPPQIVNLRFFVSPPQEKFDFKFPFLRLYKYNGAHKYFFILLTPVYNNYIIVTDSRILLANSKSP